MDEEQEKSLPLERVFWEDLFNDALLWGLETYEQDWLDRQYMFTSALHTNLTLGETWLDDMGGAADERGLNIQYCMSFIRHLLHSTRLPAVTQIRVSDDYILCPVQSCFHSIPGMKGMHNLLTICFVFTNLTEIHCVLNLSSQTYVCGPGEDNKTKLECIFLANCITPTSQTYATNSCTNYILRC